MSPYIESDSSDNEEEEEHSEIILKIDCIEARSYVKQHWYEIIEFGNSDQCDKLREKACLKRGEIEPFLIGSSIDESINDAINNTIIEMGENKKYKNFIKNSHALYLDAIMKLFLQENTKEKLSKDF